MIRWFSLCMMILWMLSPFYGFAQGSAPQVCGIEIRFDGPETVNRAVVLANIQTTVGRPFVREQIEQDVRGLIATGHFLDVRVLEESQADGVKVIYQVRGKAKVKEVIWEGNRAYKTERLRRELSVKEGDVLDEHQIHLGERKIEEIYQKAGFPDIKVDHDLSLDKDTGRAIVRVKVNEGTRVFLKRIHIGGLQKVKESVLLKAMKTKRRWWGSWLSGTGVLRTEQFADDLDLLRDYYRTRGYLDMEVLTTRVERVSAKWLVVHVDVFEGAQYRVGNVAIENAKLFSADDLSKKLQMATNQIFTPEGLSKDIKTLEDYYGTRGYLDTSVRAVKVPNMETGHIDLTYHLQEGELTYIEKVAIRGNTKTKDKVIRRELAVAPGEIYDTVRVDRSADRLRNLGFFSKVETTPEPTPIPTRKDLAITVEEQRTGSVNFGAGFSSIDNLVGFVELTQGNFDLFNWPGFTGGGQKLRLRAQLGTERQDLVLSFVEPWFLDQKLSLGFDLYQRSSSYLSGQFTEERAGGNFRLEKALHEFMRVGIQYELQNITLDVNSGASQELYAERGSDLRSSLEANWVYDTRDSVFLTTRGNRTEISAELAGGPLGGDVSVYKLNAKTACFFPFFQGHVLEIIGAAGVVQAFGNTWGSGPVVTEVTANSTNFVKVNDVPIYDRYFLGGANTLRGFDYRKVGPKDVHGEPVGGNTYMNATVEYSLPIVEKVRFALFFDVGEVERNTYNFSVDDIVADVGAGVRLNLPIGPVRIDYGYPIITDPSTGTNGRIQFSVGYQF